MPFTAHPSNRSQPKHLIYSPQGSRCRGHETNPALGGAKIKITPPPPICSTKELCSLLRHPLRSTSFLPSLIITGLQRLDPSRVHRTIILTLTPIFFVCIYIYIYPYADYPRTSAQIVVLVDTRPTSGGGDEDSRNAANAEAVTLGSVGEPGDLESFALNAAGWKGPKVGLYLQYTTVCMKA